MKQIFPSVWTWSWFSDEKGMDFNGYYIERGERKVVIDPPFIADSDLEFLDLRGVTDIILTNRDHIRESDNIRERFSAKVWAPAADASEMSAIPLDHLFKDGDLLPGDLQVVSISNGKSPGESALYMNQFEGILILGDALIGKPAGKLNLLPPEKYTDVQKAKSGLRRLLDYSFHAVLLGDGESILNDGKRAVETVLK